MRSFTVAHLTSRNEHLGMAYWKDKQVPVVILCYFGAFVPRSSFTWSGGHIPVFVDATLRDREVVIHGNGNQTRSRGNVSDFALATRLALERKATIGQIIVPLISFQEGLGRTILSRFSSIPVGH